MNFFYKLISCKLQTNKGFSLLEFIIVIAILAIITLASVVGYLNYKNVSEMDSGVSLIVSSLRLIRAKAMAGENFEIWGIHFDKSSANHFFEIFYGSSYPGTIEEINYLSNFVKLNTFRSGGSEVLSNTFDIQFNKINGKVSDNFDKEIDLILTGANIVKTVKVSKEGMITY